MEIKNSQRKPKKKHHSSKKVEKTGKTLRKKTSGKINQQQSGRRKKPKSQHQIQNQQKIQQQSSRNCVNESKMRSYYSHSEYNTSKSQLNSTHREAEGGMAIRLAPSTTVEDDPEANKVAENFYFCPSSKIGTPRNVSDYNNEADESPGGGLESRTPDIKTPKARTPSTARNSNEGRQIRLAQSVPDDDEVNKLVEKYKPRRSIMLPVSRPSILVDQMVRSRMSTPMLSEPSTDKTLATTQNIEFEDIPEMKTAMLGKQRTPPIETATARLMLEKVIEEDSYDSYPKLEQVLYKPPDIVYGLNELPNWMDYLEPTDDDMLNVEPTCSVGSEQIEMYHQKKFQLKYPPEKKIILDQWQPSMVLADRDNVLFTPQLIFSNTIRSLINVAAAKKEKQKSDDDLTQNLSEEVTLKHIDLDRTQCYTYVRSDPITSMSKKMLMNVDEIPRREDLLLFPKR